MLASVVVTVAALTFVTGCGGSGDGLGATGTSGTGGGKSPASADASTGASADSSQGPPNNTTAPKASTDPKGSAGPRVDDPKARVSYVLPSGWATTGDLLEYFTSGAQAGGDKSSSPTGGAGKSADPAAAGSFLVGVLDANLFASKEKTPQDAAHALARQFAEFFYPEKAQDVVKVDKATKVDGHDAWYTEIECVPADSGQPPFRLRVTVINSGGKVPVYTMGLADAAASARLAEIDGINQSVRFT